MSLVDIRDRLELNIARVGNLLQLASQVTTANAPTKTDLLRAAVVFLHATLEDVIRTGLELRLPQAAPEHLAMLDFAVGDATKEKITVGQLAKHRGKTVDQLLEERIEAYLERSNFNNIADVVTALQRMGVDTSVLDVHKDTIATMMLRRHWIVHRADRNQSAGGPGRHRTRPIGVNTVKTWTDTVGKFCSTLLQELEQP